MLYEIRNGHWIGWTGLVAIACLLLSCTPAPVTENSPTVLTSTPQTPGQILPIGAKVQTQGQTIQLEIAKSRSQQALGLMYRSFLPDNRGMLFPFDPPQPVQFWMKNVVLDLDIIFLANGKIVEIAAAVPPCQVEPCPTYGPNQVIDQVVELRGGRAAELGWQVGTQLEIEFIP